MIPDELLNKTLSKIEKSTVAYNYFFNNIKNPAWLQPLKEKGYFNSPPPAIRKDGYIQFPVWAASGYLLRIADKVPNEVLDIIKSLPNTDNERVMDDVVNMLLKIESPKVIKLTELVKKYINTSNYLLLDRTASDFVCKLAVDGYDRPALGLAKEMLEVLPDPEKEEKLKSDYVMIKPATKYRDYEYKSIVEKITPILAKASPIATIDMYAELLKKSIDYELTFFKENGEELALSEKLDDLSYIWKPNIAEDNEHNHDPEDVLSAALRDSVVALMKNDSVPDDQKLSKLQELAANKYSIFKRVVEYGLRDIKENEVFKSFYDTLVSDKQLAKILEDEINGIGKVTTGFVTEKPTNVLQDLNDNELIKALNNYKNDSVWSFERDSIAVELTNMIKHNPKRFVPLIKNIASTKSEYLNAAVDAFRENIDSLDEEEIIQIVNSLNEIYSAGKITDENEQRNYYEWSKSSTVRLIETLTSLKDDKTERITNKSLEPITNLLLQLCRSEDPADDDEQNFEPADLSINSTRGKAIHAIAYLLAWMRRNNAKKMQYKPLFKELDWHLNPINDPSSAVRAVYGWRLEFLYGIDNQWVTNNINEIFTEDKLGEIAFDAYARFSRVHPDELDILGVVFMKQLPRLATPPSDDNKSRHDALENFVQRIGLHYWYHTLDLSEGSIMDIILKTADVKYLAELANFIGFRLYKHNGNEPSSAELSKLKELWEALVNVTKNDATKIKVLEQFGTWFSSGVFEPEWSLNHLTYAATKAGNIHLDFAVLKHMENLSVTYPEESIKALSAMVDGTNEHWAVSSWAENSIAIIKNAYKAGGNDVKELARSLANKLVAGGYLEYRNILDD